MYPIASYTVPSSTGAQIEFTNIPQNFTHLHIRYFVRNNSSGTSAYPNMYINGDGGSAHFVNHGLGGNGSSAFALYNVNNVFSPGATAPAAGSLSNVYASYMIDILDYTNTNKLKVIKAIGGYDDNNTSGTNQGIYLLSGFNTTITGAVTQLDFSCYNPNGSTLTAGTRIDIYGITTSAATGA